MNLTPITTCHTLGDFTQQGVIPLYGIPDEALQGTQLRAARVLAREAVAPSRYDYWSLEFGKFTTRATDFQLVGGQIDRVEGFTRNRLDLLVLAAPLLVDRGDILAIRVTPKGAPPLLIGLSLVLEWGILATKR